MMYAIDLSHLNAQPTMRCGGTLPHTMCSTPATSMGYALWPVLIPTLIPTQRTICPPQAHMCYVCSVHTAWGDGGMASGSHRPVGTGGGPESASAPENGATPSNRALCAQVGPSVPTALNPASCAHVGAAAGLPCAPRARVGELSPAWVAKQNVVWAARARAESRVRRRARDAASAAAII
jgi:hypothetical protein